MSSPMSMLQLRISISFVELLLVVASSFFNTDNVPGVKSFRYAFVAPREPR